MSEEEDRRTIEDLKLVNEELTRSLKACHSMVNDYRSKLAANSNEPDPSAMEEGESLQS